MDETQPAQVCKMHGSAVNCPPEDDDTDSQTLPFTYSDLEACMTPTNLPSAPPIIETPDTSPTLLNIIIIDSDDTGKEMTTRKENKKNNP